MTCIVGIVEHDTIYMGGDSATSSGWDQNTLTLPKVFFNGEMLIGATGTTRLLQLLQYALVLPEHPEGMSVEQYLVTRFVDALRDCFKCAGLAEKEGDREKYYGRVLLGYRGYLANIDGGYGILLTDVPYQAVGSGEDYAKGSLYTSAGLMYSPEKRIELALDAASKFAFGVGGPYVILKQQIVIPEPAAVPEEVAA